MNPYIEINGGLAFLIVIFAGVIIFFAGPAIVQEYRLVRSIRNIPKLFSHLMVLHNGLNYDLSQSKLIAELNTQGEFHACYLFQSNLTKSFFVASFMSRVPEETYKIAIDPLSKNDVIQLMSNSQDVSCFVELFGEPSRA